jgi:hypothetical protein
MPGRTKLTHPLKLALTTQLLFLCILPYSRVHISQLVAVEHSLSQKRASYLVICGEPNRDVSQIDCSTVMIGTKGRPLIRPLASSAEYLDVNGDGFLDVLLRLNEDYSAIRGTTSLGLTGSMYSGMPIGDSWYVADRDTGTGAMLALYAGSIQAAQPTCTLGPFRGTFREIPAGGRLIPNGIASACGVAKPCPGTEVTADTPLPAFNFFMDGFRVNMSTSPVCVTVTTTAITCDSGVHTTAILGDAIYFLDQCAGYAGDSGVGTGTGGTTSFSFTVPPGELYSLVFAGETPATQCVDFSYTINISPCSVLCLQEDSSGDQITFSSERGTFLFRSCRFSFTLTGRGTGSRRGSLVTLTDYEPRLRVVARYDESTKRGSASVVYSPFNFSTTITDRNITDNTCQCRNP